MPRIDPFWRVIITGSREWEYPQVVFSALAKQRDEHTLITVVHGDCPTGADFYARQWTEWNIRTGMKRSEAHIAHEAYPALWDHFDKAASPIRNRYMVQLGADICLAFPTASSRGTISCMDLAAAAGIPILNYGTPREGFDNVSGDV